MNWYEIAFCIVAVIALYWVLTFKISDDTDDWEEFIKTWNEPDESNARVRMNQTHPEQLSEPIEKIIPSHTSYLISQKRFNQISPSQVAELNEDYLKLVRRLNDEVIF